MPRACAETGQRGVRVSNEPYNVPGASRDTRTPAESCFLGLARPRRDHTSEWMIYLWTHVSCLRRGAVARGGPVREEVSARRDSSSGGEFVRSLCLRDLASRGGPCGVFAAAGVAARSCSLRTAWLTSRRGGESGSECCPVCSRHCPSALPVSGRMSLRQGMEWCHPQQGACKPKNTRIRRRMLADDREVGDDPRRDAVSFAARHHLQIERRPRISQGGTGLCLDRSDTRRALETVDKTSRAVEFRVMK